MDGWGGPISTLTAAAGSAVRVKPNEANPYGCLLVGLGVLVAERPVQVSRGNGGRIPRGYPDAPDHADGRTRGQVQRPGHILRRLAARHMAGLAGDRAAHRIQSRAEPGRALERDPVVGRAGPVQLPIGQPADQGPAGEIGEGGVDLGQADVVSAGQRAAPGQPPARFAMHEGRRYPVGQHGRGLGRCARGRGTGIIGRRRSLGGRRRRLPGDRIASSGGASGHSACRDRAASQDHDAVRMPYARYRPMTTEAARSCGVRSSEPVRPHGAPEVRLFRFQRQLALTRPRPRARHGPPWPARTRPLIFITDEQKLNRRGTNRRLLDVI